MDLDALEAAAQWRGSVLVPAPDLLALIARVRRAEAALRTAAGLANELTWKAGTRAYADRLANIIRSGFEAPAALEARTDGE